jgi:hypothetical protein
LVDRLVLAELAGPKGQDAYAELGRLHGGRQTAAELSARTSRGGSAGRPL